MVFFNMFSYNELVASITEFRYFVHPCAFFYTMKSMSEHCTTNNEQVIHRLPAAASTDVRQAISA